MKTGSSVAASRATPPRRRPLHAQRKTTGRTDAFIRVASSPTPLPGSAAQSGVSQVELRASLWKQPPPGATLVDNASARGAWIHKWRCPKTGKWVHNYTLEQIERAKGAKFAQNLDFATKLPAIRKRYRQDLARSDRRGVVALIIALIDQCYFRVGNEVSEGNGVYGVTTLRPEHLTFLGNECIFEYVGKKRVVQQRVLADGDLADRLRRLKRSARRANGRLFRAAGRNIVAADVNAYLAEFGVSAKQFRTYHATRLAYSALRDSDTMSDAAVNSMYRSVADKLGNTPAVCRNSYVDPRVVEAFKQGRLT